jgi:hypothetical protein
MKTLEKQKGMTGLGWVIILLLIGFFILLGLKIIPAYMNNYKVTSVLESLKTDPELVGIGPGRVRKALLKRLDINMVSDLEPDDILIEKIGNALKVTVDYETRKSFTKDIDIVIYYNKSVEVPIR